MPELLTRKAKWTIAINLLTSHWKAAGDLEEGVNSKQVFMLSVLGEKRISSHSLPGSRSGSVC